MPSASRFLLVSLCALGLAGTGWAQQLPTKGPGDEVSKDAGQLIEGLPILTEPLAGETEPERTLSIEQADARLAEARRKQQRWAKLALQGILSKAEAEQCDIEVAKAAAHCAGARLAQAMQRFDSAQPNPAAAAEAAAALEKAKADAAQANATLDHTRLQNAQTSLARFRILYTEKLVTKSQFQRMEAQVAKMQAEITAQ